MSKPSKIINTLGLVFTGELNSDMYYHLAELAKEVRILSHNSLDLDVDAVIVYSYEGVNPRSRVGILSHNGAFSPRNSNPFVDNFLEVQFPILKENGTPVIFLGGAMFNLLTLSESKVQYVPFQETSIGEVHYSEEFCNFFDVDIIPDLGVNSLNRLKEENLDREYLVWATDEEGFVAGIASTKSPIYGFNVFLTSSVVNIILDNLSPQQLNNNDDDEENGTNKSPVPVTPNSPVRKRRRRG